MHAPPRTRLCLVDDARALAERAAREVVKAIARAQTERGVATLVLSGGSTPRALYELLASEPWRPRVDWQGVEFYWGDERCVPPEDPRSNFALARAALLEPLGLDARRWHRMRGELPPEEAAGRYAEELPAPRPGGFPCFDLVLLGLGADGHTASLFPGDAALEERRLAVAPALAPVEPRERVTLTLPTLDAARRVLFLVSGEAKAAALEAVLDEPSPHLPASFVRPTHGELVWLVDRPAAAALLATEPGSP